MGGQEEGAKQPLSELEIYNVYRDYIKHEDGLMNARLSSFLTMNSFLIGLSVLILGGMLNILIKGSPHPERLLPLMILGTLLHTVLAWIGRDAANLTESSIQAATDSLKILRDDGNRKLASAIERGQLPYLTDARELDPGEKKKLETGSGIMRGFPRHMKHFWLFLAVTPLLITGFAALIQFNIVLLS